MATPHAHTHTDTHTHTATDHYNLVMCPTIAQSEDGRETGGKMTDHSRGCNCQAQPVLVSCVQFRQSETNSCVSFITDIALSDPVAQLLSTAWRL